jgi:hypothetical protein
MGIGPTGKQVTVSGLTLSRLANGKVIEEYTNWERSGWRRPGSYWRSVFDALEPRFSVLAFERPASA